MTCSFAFETLYILPHGFSTCCEAWLDRSIPVYQDLPPWEAWNHMNFQKLRIGTLDGSFTHCQKCVRFLGGDVPEAGRDDWQPQMTRGPSRIIMCNDRVCNLQCWTCRPGVVGRHRESEAYRRRVMSETMEAFKGSIEYVQLLQSGEVFASPMHLEWLATADEYPRLNCIELTTNGTLMASHWSDISQAHPFIKRISVSVDAGTQETYEQVRHPAKWSDVMAGLEHASALKRAGDLDYLQISMVVYSDNFRDIPAFIELGRKLEVSTAIMTVFRPWWQRASQFTRKDIRSSQHPEHAEYKALIESTDFSAPFVDARQVIGDLKDCPS